MTIRLLPWLILFLVTGCSDDIEPGTRQPQSPLLTGLPLATAQRTPLAEGKSLPATVQRSTRTTLVARSDGRVNGFSVRGGETVEAGEILLTLSDNQADARLRSARSHLEAARSVRGAAKAQQQLADRTYERYARLREGEAVTPQEMDRVATEREAARTALARAEAEVRAAEADLAAAQVALGYTVLKAPFAATVVRKETRDGATVLPGTPLVTLDRRGGWELLAEVPESLWSRLALGQEVATTVPALGLELSGRVSEKLPATDPGSRSFPVKVALPDDDRLQSGMFARLRLPAEEREVLTVPASALVERGQLTGLYRVEEGQLRFSLVKIGRRLGDRVEILSGLEAGERVVAGETSRAVDGARVQE